MGELWIEWEKDEVRSKIESKINELPSKALGLVDDMAEVTEVYMKDESPVKFGDTQNSIVTEVMSDLERWVGPTVAHAIFIIKGTKAHIIEAVNAMALGPFFFSSYMGAGIGGYVKPNKANSAISGLQYFKSVHHPGTAPNDFVTRSKERSEGRHSELVQEFLGWLTE
jgi:hypothetical protein